MKTEEIVAVPVQNGQLYPLSVEAYHVLGEAGFLPKNTELLFGLVYKKMPKSPIHAALIGRLIRLLGQIALEGFWVRSEQPIVSGSSEPEPDISIVQGSVDDYTRHHPRSAEFVAEVCVTSEEYDRSKLPIYAAAGVKECWLVFWPQKQIEVFTRPVEGQYLHSETVSTGELASGQFPQLRISLAQFFRE